MPLTQELYDQIHKSHAKLVSPDGNTQDLPASLDDFLVKLSADLRKGQSRGAAAARGVALDELLKRLERSAPAAVQSLRGYLPEISY